MTRIPDGAGCLIPGCAATPCFTLGVRLRRPDTSAVWAPDIPGYLCELHGTGGGTLTIIFEPNDTGYLDTFTMAATAPVYRSTPIRCSSWLRRDGA